MTAGRSIDIADLMASVAHQLNNPLAAVIGYAQLATHEEDPERVRHALRVIGEEADVCKHIVAALERCFVVPTPTLVTASVRDLTDAMVITHGAELEAAGIRFVTDVADGLPEVLVDKALIGRALGCLMDNARHSLLEQPKPRIVTLGARTDGRFLVVEVRDNGQGIPPQDIKNVFSPTFTTRGSGRGLGLGLPTVMAILEKHDGDVVVAADAGQGAVVQLLIPLSG